MTLGDAAVGSTVIVAKIDGDGAYKRRIMDMGITKGSEIFILEILLKLQSEDTNFL